MVVLSSLTTFTSTNTNAGVVTLSSAVVTTIPVVQSESSNQGLAMSDKIALGIGLGVWCSCLYSGSHRNNHEARCCSVKGCLKFSCLQFYLLFLTKLKDKNRFLFHFLLKYYIYYIKRNLIFDYSQYFY